MTFAFTIFFKKLLSILLQPFFFAGFNVSTIDSFSYERELLVEGLRSVAGIDEAGRGPLAGPVVAAAVILPMDCDYLQFKDSKKLSVAKREFLFSILEGMNIPIGVGVASPREIEEINILQASLLAMKRAVLDLSRLPDFLLVDGKFPVPLHLPQKSLIKGETRSASIAAASIVAKVTRDRLMMAFHKDFPQYNFDKHKGYPTKNHKQLLQQFGPCEIHRKTFSGVREHIV